MAPSAPTNDATVPMSRTPDGGPMRTPILDPRLGDFESDHSSPKQRSLLAIAGSLIGEISLPKLAVIWTIQILAPAVLLGLAPLILTAWIGAASNRLAEAGGVGAAIVAIAAAAAARYGWRPAFRPSNRTSGR